MPIGVGVGVSALEPTLRSLMMAVADAIHATIVPDRGEVHRRIPYKLEGNKRDLASLRDTSA